MNSTVICEVARDAGIGLKQAKDAGVEVFDRQELVKAGVPRGHCG
jgi:hypothetical protein